MSTWFVPPIVIPLAIFIGVAIMIVLKSTA
jgi:hypothetical protein